MQLRKCFHAVLVTAIVSLVAVPAAAQETGTVTGTVSDDFNAMTLPTAQVAVVGTTFLATSDMDGRYALQLPAGTYGIRFTFPGYDERVVTDVVVTAGGTVQLDVVLQLTGMALEETVVVTAETMPELVTAQAQLLERRRAGNIGDNIAREEMRANSDSDAASAMKRVTGLSVVDNQYVFVRGLGERYSNSMLNGSILPTTEPDKRVVPLDLIPTGLIESVQVAKSYLPDRPGEFSGGLIQIETVRAPRIETWALGTKQTFNSQTTFKGNGLTYPGSGTDWLGFDDGRRALPGSIPGDNKVIRGNRFDPTIGYTPDELQQFGLAFENVWSAQGTSHSQDEDYSGSYGVRAGRFGLAASLGYRAKPRNRTEQRNFFNVGQDENGESVVELQSTYDFTFSDVNTRLGALANVSYEIADGQRVTWANFWTHQSNNETRVFEGFNNDVATDIRDERLYWIEQDLLTSTLRGEHLVPSLQNSRIDWRANYSRAKRDEPDLRETLYEYNPTNDEYELADESQSGFRMFSDLDDEVYDLALDWSVFLPQWSGLPTQLRAGPQYTRRDRTFQSRRFRYQPRNRNGIDITATPEEIFAPENIRPDGFELREETRPTDAYTAEQEVLAFYVMADMPITQRWRFIGGARVEDSRQLVETFDPFATDPTPIVADLKNTDLLPSLNLVYELSNRAQLRLGYSRTLNRPEFRELSPFEFTDVVGGRAVIGNPDLRRAKIDNYDLRWEWFPNPGEVFAVSVFFKDFTDPIERVVQPTSQLRTSYTNALGAKNKGFELEARKTFARRWTVNLNYTYVDSQIELERTSGQVQTSVDRALVGQSPHVVNAHLAYTTAQGDLDIRALFNYSAARITDVGSLGLPDIYEAGRGALDLVVSKQFGALGVRLIGTNLNDAVIRYTQGGQDQRTFRRGRSIAFALSYGMPNNQVIE